MPTFRAYLNKAKGNEHSRIHDFDADDFAAAGKIAAKEAKKGEVVGEIVELWNGVATADDLRLAEARAENERLRAELAAALGRPA